MKGILVIAHGNREQDTVDVLDAIVSMAREKLPGTIIEWTFMGISGRTIENGITELKNRGIAEIKIVPYFLFKGKHLKEDLPRIMAQCAADFPEITITMGEHLGLDERLADILVDRIKN